MKLFEVTKSEHQTIVYMPSDVVWWVLIGSFGLCISLEFILPFVHAVSVAILGRLP